MTDGWPGDPMAMMGDAGDPQGIAFALQGVDELTFARILRDLLNDPHFGKPLRVLAQEPRPGQDARLTLVFRPADRPRAVSATQRLKTVLLRYGVQVDSVQDSVQDGPHGASPGAGS